MRVNESRQNDAAAKVQFFGPAGVAEALDLAAGTDGGDAAIAGKDGAIGNNAEVTESRTSPRRRATER
jgi:hypothetical protein